MPLSLNKKKYELPKLKPGIAVVPIPKEGIAVVKPPPKNGIAVVAKITININIGDVKSLLE